MSRAQNGNIIDLDVDFGQKTGFLKNSPILPGKIKSSSVTHFRNGNWTVTEH